MPSAFSKLQFLPCKGDVPGKVYTAPGSPVIAVSYNGMLLRSSAPLLGYNVTGNVITLDFSTEQGDSIYALCVA